MIGRTIGHYRVLEKLGEGGMGEVYLAEDISLPRKVALKFLPEILQQDEIARKRFLREAESAAVLDHPFICHINEVARDGDGRDFIVMEYVEGQTLRDRMADGPLPLKKALLVGVEVADALEFAHQRGIVHRDLKPANIMLTPQGHAKIMDFGLAKRLVRGGGEEEDLTSALTRDGATLGTPGYMSPEQVRAQPVDHRSDIFSFGIVLYEMLTGVHPFRRGTQHETVGAILHEEPPEFSAYLTGAPELLQHTLRKMLAKDPEERFQAVHEIRTNLDEIRENSGSQAIGGRSASPRFRRTSWAVLGSAALLLAAAVAVISSEWLTLNKEVQQGFSSSRPIPVTTSPGFEFFPDFSPDGGRIVYCGWQPGGDSDVWVRQVGPGDPLRLTSEPHLERFPRWSPDGQLIAFARFFPERQKVAVLAIPALGGTEVTLIELGLNRGREPSNDSGLTGLSWAPDGGHLAISYRPEGVDESRVFLLDLKTADLEAITAPPDGILGDFQAEFSRDGRQIGFFRRLEYSRWTLYVQPLSAAIPRLVTEMSFQNACGLTWSPDGRELIFSAGAEAWKEVLWSADLSGGDAVPLFGPGGNVSSRWPSLSPGGDRLTYSEMPAARSDVWRVDRSGMNLRSSIASTRWDGRPQLSPDGEMLAFCSDRTGFLEIYVCQADGSKIRAVTDLKSECGSPSWSPDGLRIAFDSVADGNRDVYVAEPGTGGPVQLTKDTAADAMPSWSRDGRWLYYHSNRSGDFQLWKLNLETGEQRQLTKAGGWFGQESPDGRFVYFQKADVGEIWRMPVDGGEEVRILPSKVHAWGWVVTSGGLYLMSSSQWEQDWLMKIRLLGSAGESIQEVLDLQVPGHPVGLTVAPGGKAFAFGLDFPNDNADIMLVENFR